MSEGPANGHTFRITFASRGSYGLMTGPELDLSSFEDAKYWDKPRTVEVRAWSLIEALVKAAALPLSAWFDETEEAAGDYEPPTDEEREELDRLGSSDT